MNKKLFCLSCACDLCFLIAFLLIYYSVMQHSIPVLQRMSELSTAMGNPDVLDGAELDMQSASELIALQKSLVRWIFTFFFGTFLAWILFESLGHWLAASQIEKTDFHYVRKFIAVSFVFYLFAVSCFWIAVMLSSLNAQLFIPIFTQGIINAIVIILLAVIFYFWLYALVLIRNKGAKEVFFTLFPSGVKQFPRIISAYFISLLIISGGLLVAFLFQKVQVIVFYAGLAVLVMSLSYARLMFFKRIRA